MKIFCVRHRKNQMDLSYPIMYQAEDMHDLLKKILFDFAPRSISDMQHLEIDIFLEAKPA